MSLAHESAPSADETTPFADETALSTETNPCNHPIRRQIRPVRTTAFREDSQRQFLLLRGGGTSGEGRALPPQSPPRAVGTDRADSADAPGVLGGLSLQRLSLRACASGLRLARQPFLGLASDATIAVRVVIILVLLHFAVRVVFCGSRQSSTDWVELGTLSNGSKRVPDAGATHRGKESIFLMREPLTGGKRAYS
eukprot:1179926-Prorocentrum_minimum.AAC.4